MKEYFQADEVFLFNYQVRRRNSTFAQRRGESEQLMSQVLSSVSDPAQRNQHKAEKKSMQMKVLNATKLSTHSGLGLKADPS